VSALAHLSGHIAKWRLTQDGEPFETRSSWLCFVQYGGKPAVLKVYKPNSDETRGADILRHWGERAVRVYAADEAAMVVERIVPALPLSALTKDDDDRATHIWCDTVAGLHVAPAPKNWKTLFDCGRSYNKPYPDHSILTRGTFERGKSTFFELCETQSAKHFLLHADLHHDNVLNDSERGWLVIDPKGYSGELEFETASFLHNPAREFRSASVLERRARILSDRLELDHDRILRWCFAHGVLSALWNIEDAVDDVGGGIESANAAAEVLGWTIDRKE
jgi:streptomycin 6-kinase